MKLKRLLLILSLSLMPFFASAGELRVLVTVKPLALIMQALLPEAGMPAVLVKSGDLHDYKLSVADLALLEEADAVLWIGPEHERFLARVYSKLDQPDSWITLKSASGHPWLDPHNLESLLGQMAEQMQQWYPQHADDIAARHEQLGQEIKALQAQYQLAFKPYAGQAFILAHNAYQELLHELGLEGAVVYQAGHHHGHHQHGMQSSLEIQKTVAEGKIHCAFAEPNLPLDSLSKRFPALNIATLDPMATLADSGSGAFLQYYEKGLSSVLDCLSQTPK